MYNETQVILKKHSIGYVLFPKLNMKKRLEKILITGSSGTIGTRLFEKLLEKNYRVIGFDKKPNKWHPRLNKLTIIGNLLNKKDVGKLPGDFDLVIHLAANPRVYDLVLSPDLALENIITTYNILEFCRDKKIKNLIFSSSRETYGNRRETITKEKDINIYFCESPYAASKISSEALIYSYSKCYGIDYIIFRLSNVYGMYDQNPRFIPLLVEKMQKNQNINIYGKNKVLDFTYIDDCIQGIMKGIEKFTTTKNNVLNIGSGRGENLIDVAGIMKKKLSSKSKIFVKKNRTGEVVKYIADISKAGKLLDYNPKYNIERGINLTIDWYLNY